MRKPQDPVQDYVEKLSVPRSRVLCSIEQSLRQDEKWGINIGSVEGLFLQFLIRSHGVRRILEIGTQYGYSTQWMLEALPGDGEMVSIEKSPEHHQKAKSLILDQRADFILGDATEILEKMPESYFDLIFIDANKKAYPQYLKHAKKLVKKGGLIVGDNTFLFGSVLSDVIPELTPVGLWQAMRDFNEQIFKDPQFVACIVPTAEGLTVAYKT